MKIDEKRQFLERELGNRIEDTARKRKRNKWKAFGLKIFAVFLAATVTILLGLKVGAPMAEWFRNIAFALAAIITVVNAIEAFYDHRSLWIRKTTTLGRLYNLQRDFNFYVSGKEQADIEEEALERFLEQIDLIMQDELKAWLRLREETTPVGGQTPTIHIS